MIIKPRFKKFFCITAHPAGCEYNVYNQINYVKNRNSFIKKNGPKKVLIIGSSSGFGLASNIVTTFGFETKTIAVCLEKKKNFLNFSTEGLYNIKACSKFAKILGLYYKNINCDAFSDECKNKVIKLIKKDLGKIDLVIYSISSKYRKLNNNIINAVIKPIGKQYTNKTINISKTKILNSTIEAANDKEIKNTISVMGGSNWESWMLKLKKANVLENNIITIAYSCMSNEIIKPIYKNGTIGLAKLDLNYSVKNIKKYLKELNGIVHIVILKTTVTKSSYLNPFMNLYMSILYKVMKKQNTHEDCIGQIFRLMTTCLYNKHYKSDKYNRIRMDNWEKKKKVQKNCKKIWSIVNSNNFKEYTDYFYCKRDFLRLFGFRFPEIDYKIDFNKYKNFDII